MVGVGAGQIDQATHGIAGGDGDRRAAEQGVEGVAQVVFGCGLFLALVAQAVVDRSAIGDLPGPGVDDQHLGRARQVERLGYELRLVDEDRVGNPPLFGLRGDRRATVLEVGVQHEELDAPGCIGVADRGVVGEGVAHDGAAVALHDQYHRGRVGVVVELVGRPALVEEHEVVDARARRMRPRRSRTDRR